MFFSILMLIKKIKSILKSFYVVKISCFYINLIVSTQNFLSSFQQFLYNL